MKKIFIKTYGCSLNQSDSELMAGLINESKRYKIVSGEQEADIVIINSCTVKKDSEKNFIQDIKRIKKPKILAGCVPQADNDRMRFSGYPIIGTSNLTKVVGVLDDMEKGKNTILLDRRREARLNLPKIRKNSVVAIIPVSEGCLGACHYCKVKQARGDLFSYDIPTIAAEIETAVREGIREIWLTSQDMGCYGFDIGTNLVELLRYLTKIKGEFLLRIGMANPNHVLDYLDELIDIYDDPKIFKFLHIPVQSGNDRMLKSMNRKYRVSDFKKIVSRFRKAFPEIAVSTDIICGLPGETLEEFNESVDLIKKTRPDVLNISRFWARPGTVAAGMDGQVHGKVSKIWSQELTKTFHKIALENNQKWISWEGDVIIDEIGRNNTFVGRNYAYKPVIVKGTHRLGDIVKVKIKKVTKFDLSD